MRFDFSFWPAFILNSKQNRKVIIKLIRIFKQTFIVKEDRIKDNCLTFSLNLFL